MTKMHGGYEPHRVDPVALYFAEDGAARVNQAIATHTEGASAVLPNRFTPGNGPSEATETAEIIDKYSMEVVHLLGTATFRQLPGIVQYIQLQAMARKAEQESRVKGKYTKIAFYDPDEPASQYGHETPGGMSDRRLYVAPNADMSQVSRMSTVPETLGGICIGLFSLEQHHQIPVQIRTDDDLIDAAAGLCLGLEPDRDTLLSTGTKSTDIICVPVSGQNFDAIFV